ncbi:hypothetical protein AeNC1_016061 [Aphanomyces euteiches]|nr:hypothetical protein AeNC1_016061 [Aphanomyces euteiches]
MAEDPRASWSDDKDATWLTEMIHQAHVLGKTANSGFKREAWVAALSKLNTTHNVRYNIQQLKARHAELKKQYSVVSQMMKTSGIGFESVSCRFVCTEGSWSHFLRDKPKKWSLWETKRFPQYPLCQSLYDGTLATGEYATLSIASNVPNTLHAQEHENDFGGNDEQFQVISDQSDEEKDEDEEECEQRPPKRMRHSLAGAMLAEMKSFRESGREEMDLMRQRLITYDGDRHELVPVQIAMDLLHADFEYVLETGDMSFAYEVLEDPKKAMQFVRMRGDAREVWLRRHIKIKEIQHSRMLLPSSNDI